MRMMDYLLEKYKHGVVRVKLNIKLVPVSNLGMTETSAVEWNKIYDWVRERELPTLVFGPSGGVSISAGNYVCRGYGVRETTSSLELVYVEGGTWRFQFRAGNADNSFWGHQAMKIFQERCLKEGINLEDYARDDGADIKQEIEPYMISLTPGFEDLTFFGANHIDFHSSFPAGLVNTHPEFGPVVEFFYNGRKEKKEYKSVLNNTIGYLQSVKMCGARWAHLSRDAIADNNRRIRELADRLQESGRVIIAYNTDGIWYLGDVYHGEGEGPALGQWENDHVGCKIRFKSKGAYEYEENGVYCPVVRGATRLDKIRPRSEWHWGDIYGDDAEVVKFFYEAGVGIVDEKGVKYI